MKKLILISFFFFYCLTAFTQSKTDLNVDFMVRGYLYAASTMEDSLSLGGFGGSDNMPKLLTNASSFTQTGSFLMIDTTKHTSFADRFNGYKLFLVNKTDSTVKLDASDSRLYITAEAFVGNKWQPIEYLPSSWCGNSYHQVYLKSNQYWEFSIPKYNGRIQTKIRYKLLAGKNFYIYSNEITGAINKKQLSNKQGHIPQGIMDPYVD